MSVKTEIPPEHIHPNLLRRLAAMVYDALLLLAIVMICFMPVPILSESFRQSQSGKLLLQAYLLLILYTFFGWFWTHRGQTLGMRAWRIKLITHDGGELSWFMALKRFVLAFISLGAFGLGLLMCMVHPKNMSFHDLYSGTKLVLVEKKKKHDSGNPSKQQNPD